MYSFFLVCPVAFLGFTICYLVYVELFPHPFPKSLPLVGFRKEIFSRPRASFRQILGSSQTLAEGYEQYGAAGRPYVVPDTTFQPQVMLPQNHIKWLSTQPESVLSSEAVRVERNGINYLPVKSDLKSSVLFIDKIIGKSLSQNLDLIQPDMYDEIRHTVDSTMGTDVASWREVNLSEAMSTIIDRTGNRILFGLSLCRNEVYLRILRCFIIFMGASTLLIGQLPPWFLRPIAGVLITIPTFIFKKLSVAYVRPLVKERMQSVSGEEDDQGPGKTSHDFVTQSINSVRKFKITIEGDVASYLAEQFLFLAFAAMATTGAAATNIFLDILSASPQINLYELLHLEAASIFKSEADWMSPSSMKEMINTDSAIRESLRKNTLQSRGLLKQVMPKDGIMLPDGAHVPHGMWLGVPAQAMQNDDEFYPNADGYDPLRFARLKADAEAECKDGPSSGKHLDAAHPSDKYLSFSYGRSSCPGRWFAVRLLKLIIAYIAVHYDIKPLAHRPKNFSFGDASIPSFTTKIMVRRRKQG
ncbi:hypothetical protein AJ80_03957 [Polytolypa hystricis UAMH7299]|uniref:Cytochrome P450 monooxygenase polB n=1 Tax=Polytolypa hystricis (strain UAMH7299) TaxID=1447883 RepID=POLB_POLH7|nr:hypothetical protein AJ80_03957 [Polytolypa hystricis UAMH7299]